MKIPEEIIALLDRAKEFSLELKEEHDNCIESGKITNRIKIITHDVLSKCRQALDLSWKIFWERDYAPNLSNNEREQSKVYFPISKSPNGISSILGMAKIRDLEIRNNQLFNFINDIQKFSNPDNNWLLDLRNLDNTAKHIKLISQRQQELIFHDVKSNLTHISWMESSKKSGYPKMLDPVIDPQTKRVRSNLGLIHDIEQIPRLMIEENREDLLIYCWEVREKVSNLLKEFFQLI